ncbi:hypothetical protein ACLB2K_036828 [Fragaria x ananassa]
MASLVLLLSVLVRPIHVKKIEQDLVLSITSASCAATDTAVSSAPRKLPVEEIGVLEEEEEDLSDCSTVTVESVWP